MIRPILVQLALVLLCSIVASASEPEAFKGKVVSVHDGDTVTVLHGKNKKTKVRLEGIDAPEIGQPFGESARKALDDMVYGRVVTVEASTIDKYGRTIGRVVRDGSDINFEMVRIGLAWRYDQYSQDPALGRAQQNAQNNHWGLWRDTHPTPPWVWRRIHPLK